MRDIVLKVQDVSKQYTKDSSFVFSNYVASNDRWT